jgi:hypothetical protein
MYSLQLRSNEKKSSYPGSDEIVVVINSVSKDSDNDNCNDNNKREFDNTPTSETSDTKKIKATYPIDDYTIGERVISFVDNLKCEVVNSSEWIDGDDALKKGIEVSVFKKLQDRMKFSKNNLKYACKSGNLETVKCLMETLDRCMVYAYFGDSAIESGNAELVEWLITNVLFAVTGTNYCFGSDAFLIAVQIGKLDVLEVLWKYIRTIKVPKKSEMFYNCDPVWIAANCGHLDVVKWFCEKFDNETLKKFMTIDESAIEVAMDCRYLDIAKWLHYNHKGVHSGFKLSSLVSFIFESNGLDCEDFIKSLIEKARDNSEWNWTVQAELLASAAGAPNFELIKWIDSTSPLCACGQKVSLLKQLESFSTGDKTIMDAAIIGGSVEICDWCKQNGYMVTLTERGLSQASRHCRIDTLKWIMKELPYYDVGKRACISAAEEGHVQVLDLFKDTRFDLNRVGMVEAAIKFCKTGVLKWLKTEGKIPYEVIFNKGNVMTAKEYCTVTDASGIEWLFEEARIGDAISWAEDVIYFFTTSCNPNGVRTVCKFLEKNKKSIVVPINCLRALVFAIAHKYTTLVTRLMEAKRNGVLAFPSIDDAINMVMEDYKKEYLHSRITLK